MLVAGALLALGAAMALLLASLVRSDGTALVWLSLAADAVAITLLVTALRGRRPSPADTHGSELPPGE